ncbi:MAG: NAD-dependent epimerase [Spirochaeta sp.]|jgi:UDP-glucuronate 4-epimerase|nr:NAD-dependent epimerase [Spirochaeta sp.]
MKVLLTGIAGFIGFHLAQRMVARGDEVVGLDNINDYYDVGLKLGRLAELGVAELGVSDAELAPGPGPRLVPSHGHPNLRFVKMDLEDRDGLKDLLRTERFDAVVHLAAQAGVRYSLSNPHSYVSSNVEGFLSLLEAVRQTPVNHLVYASSSSVYGLETEQPFHEEMAADRPASLYAASKRSNELMAHSYSHLYGIPVTGLRFFTVYGSWYRPDMALYRFADAMTAGRPIQVYNHGKMERDFTYVDDIVEGMVRVLDRPPVAPDTGAGAPPYRVYNIGNGAPVPLMKLIGELETAFGITAEKEMLPMQPGDVTSTWADCTALERDTGYKPNTPIRDGIRAFVEWYRSYHGS